MEEYQENTSLRPMNNTGLQTQNVSEIAPGISSLDKELVVSYKQDPKFKEMDSTQIITKISELIYNVFFEVLDKITPDIDKENIVAKNIRDINRYFSYYSLKDIERCYEMGVRGEFTQKIQKFQGACNVSVEMLFSWLREFKTHHGKIIRRQAQFESGKHEQLLLENKEEHQRQHQRFLQTITEEYNKFLSEPQYPVTFQRDYGNTIYNYFSKGQQVNLKTTTKEKLVKQALKAYIEQYNGLRGKLSVKSIVKSITDSVKPIEDIIFKSPMAFPAIDVDVERDSPSERVERLNWLKQLPPSFKKWNQYIKTEEQQKMINDIFFMAKRLALRVVIYEWKKESRKIEDIINEIEKAQSAK